jgi:lipoprotein-anchoring transpeptidase ErfK/SrfK
VRLQQTGKADHRAVRAGGILLRRIVFVAFAAVAWIWWQSGGTSSTANAASPTVVEPVKQPDGTLVIPTRDSSGKRAEPMLLVPVSARISPPTTTPPNAQPPLQSNVPPPALTSLRQTNASAAGPGSAPRSPFDERILSAQIGLARSAISSGSFDGVMGSQTRAALRVFQKKEDLPATGSLDEATMTALTFDGSLYTNYVVTSEDVASLQPLSTTWLAKSQQSSLAHESVLELVSERTHSNPKLVRWLNPGVDWDRVSAGTSLRLVYSEYPEPTEKAAAIRIFLNDRKLQVYGAESNLLAHFPCSIAARVDKRPLGEELHIAAIAPNPNYTFDPAVFPESAEAQELGRKLILQPGPNNPVGTVWLGLDKPGYGIHGTPKPEEVGRTESHGCFRLANWNAEYLLKLVAVGTPVFVEP